MLASSAYALSDKLKTLTYIFEIATEKCPSKEIEEKVLSFL
jgi:hypothetical protein